MSTQITKTIIVQKNDAKSRKWREASMNLGLNLVLQNGTPINAPWVLLRTIITTQKPDGYVIRYLNDYPSFTKTMIRTASELVLLMLCKILRVKVFWICHNVDKETDRHYPIVSTFRRNIISSFCTKLFVTDALLREKARRIFPRSSNKVDNISFGKTDARHEGTGDQIGEKFLALRRSIALSEGKKFISVLCAGSPNNAKYLHFPYLLSFIDHCTQNGYDVGVVVAGDWDNSKRSQHLLSSYRSNPSVLVFETFTSFSASFIRANIDCYFRGYDDYSVPFTVYEACTLGIPIVALDVGFLPSMIRHYKIGQVIDTKFLNIKDALARLNSDSYQYQTFLKENNWSVFGSKVMLLL